jgi:hypothetical protein
MNRKAQKRLQRALERDRWLKAHGRRCVACGRALDDDDLLEGVDPRQPRTCIDCCGAVVGDDQADAAIEAGWAYRRPVGGDIDTGGRT